MALRPKQQRFVEEYLKDLNATQAAIRAGYSVKAATEIGSRLLTFAKVKRTIEIEQAKLSERCNVKADWIVKRLREEADARGEGTTHGARVKALELLGKYLGLFIERQEHSGPGGKPVETSVRVFMDKGWYRNDAWNRVKPVAAGPDAASGAHAGGPEPVQGDSLREAVRKNGNGSVNGHNGTRH